MEDFVRKTRGVRDINSLPLDTNHELDIVSDVKGKIYIKILNRYKELLFDNGTDQWVIDMLNNLEVDVEQLKEDILDVEQALSELPIIEDKMEAVETKLAQINTLFAQMQIDVKGLDLRTAELEREVIQLALKDQELLDKINNLDMGKISTLYSNSIDFGDYDYSGNPNLMSKLKSPDFNSGYHGSITDVNGMLHFTSDGTGSISMFTRIDTPALASGKTYTLSAKVRFDEGTTGAIDKLRLVYRTAPGEKILLEANSTNITTDDVGKEITIKGTANVNYQITNVDRFYLTVSFTNQAKINGGFMLSHIKIEEGSTATPYQPNLLGEPYYLSKVPLGENIANPTGVFPISTSNFILYNKLNIEKYEAGQTYTLTMKATKPATQTFRVFIIGGAQSVGTMTPVEGKVDEWKITFTVSQGAIDAGATNLLQVQQDRNASLGPCQIDWLKIEKGDTRTPNIPYYKYVGINLKESENPNDYEWIPLASAAETVNDRLSKTVSTYDTVNALQNNRLTTLESKVVDTTWQNVTVTEPFTSVTQPQFKKQNGIVYMRGTISNGTGDCFTLPEGFRPPEGAYEMQFRLPCRSTDASDYATMYVRPSGLCSIAGVNGTKPIFLSGIIFSTT